jgi:electron transport complex protein RnfD
VVAIGIGKMTFGGLGNNPFNPALVGRVFMLISFPVQMTSWPRPVASRWRLDTVLNFREYPADYMDAFTGATPLGVFKEGGSAIPSTFDMLIGNMGGSMGEVSAIALLIGFVYLLVRRVITWHIPVSIIVSIAVFTGELWLANPEANATPVFHLLTGGMLLGAIFMATDYVTSPMSVRSMIVYGVGIGVITVVIRVFGAYPEGMSFAILIMNAFVPLMNRYIKPLRFGVRTEAGS